MDEDIAKLISKIAQKLMSEQRFSLCSDNWYQLQVAFKFEMQDKKIVGLDLANTTIHKINTKKAH